MVKPLPRVAWLLVATATGAARPDGGGHHGRPAGPRPLAWPWKWHYEAIEYLAAGVLLIRAAQDRRERLAWSFLALGGRRGGLRRPLLGHLAGAARIDPVPVRGRCALPLVLPRRLRRARTAPACARRALPRERLARRRGLRARTRGSRRRARLPDGDRHDRWRGRDGHHEHRLPDRRCRDARIDRLRRRA